MSERCGVLVVGAGCAGAALATHLARAGVKVIVLEAGALPTGERLSTHLIQPPGMAGLDQLGLADAVGAMAPALTFARLAFDQHEARLPYQPGRPAYCLRRERLDPLIQDAASAAGADLRGHSRVTGLLSSPDGRISGVRLIAKGGSESRVEADLVVGADGRHSTVARAVGAAEYLGYDGSRSAYWAYWQRPSSWAPDHVYNGFFGHSSRVVFPTDGDLLLVPSAPPVELARRWRSAHEQAYVDDIHGCPVLGPHLAGARPVTKVRGALRPRYFFRASAGPGWALIGDAGHHKEFIIGLGISDALRDARGLAAAILTGRDEAADEWWRQRDVERVEMHHWARDLGEAREVGELQRLTAEGLKHEPRIAQRFAEVIEGDLRPFDLVPAGAMMRWIAAGIRRGQRPTLQDVVTQIRRRRHARRAVQTARRAQRRVV